MLLYAIDIPFFFPSFSSITTPIRSTSNTNLTFNVYILSLSPFLFSPPNPTFRSGSFSSIPVARAVPSLAPKQAATNFLARRCAKPAPRLTSAPPSLSLFLSLCLSRSLAPTHARTDTRNFSFVPLDALAIFRLRLATRQSSPRRSRRVRRPT